MDIVLEEMKQQFINKDEKERKAYFSSPSDNAQFTNSQLFFNVFSQNYKLHDGEFNKMCNDMETFLGKDIYTSLMDNLHRLRNQKVQEIKESAPDLLTHISNISPEKMGHFLTPQKNLNQFGENEGNFVFATESESERDFYALRVTDREGKNINWKKRATIDGKKRDIFIMEQLSDESYTYFLPKENFSPVVCLDGRFGHEWTADKKIRYVSCEKNDLKEIKSRNTIMLINREKFLSQNQEFYQNLNNPDLIISTLENSGVLRPAQEKISYLRHNRQPQTTQSEITQLSQTETNNKTTFSHNTPREL
ncbi:MAG: hypothetical protein J6Y53_01765 [Alphaproteobacteria bacterium]|nr:hypothetical protein [Alphaproteobacteria bacterium]